MTKITEKLASEIHSLSDIEKLHLVDFILTDLDKPDPEIDRVWAKEARKRWAAYKSGRIPAVSYQEVMKEIKKGKGYSLDVVLSDADKLLKEESEQRAFMQGVVRGLMDLEEGRETSLCEAKKRLGLKLSVAQEQAAKGAKGSTHPQVMQKLRSLNKKNAHPKKG